MRHHDWEGCGKCYLAQFNVEKQLLVQTVMARTSVPSKPGHVPRCSKQHSQVVDTMLGTTEF